MDEKLIVNIIVGAVSAIATYLFSIIKLKKELGLKYDTDLRKKRIDQYLELWKLLEDLAKYARPKELTFEGLEALTIALREWYFQKGGLFLSDNSRDRYFDLQEAIKKVLDEKSKSGNTKLAEEYYESLRKKGSSLRTALARDVGTRKAPKLN
jgi:hypothetical protein